MKKVTLYTKSYCPYCRKAIALLSNKGADFTNVDVTNDEKTFDEIKGKTGWDTVPQIFIEDEFVGGCDDLHQLDREGVLDQKLGL